MSKFKSVFTVDELKLFFDPYFRRYAWERDYLEIQSLNTGHFWLLIKDPAAEIPVKLLHKYSKNQPYHHQCGAASIYSAIRKIKKHDDYVLKKTLK